MVHMIPERDTDSVAPTPTPQQHPRHSQHHHLSLHELRALQVCGNISTYDKSMLKNFTNMCVYIYDS